METNHTPGTWKVKHSQSKNAFNIIGSIPGTKYKIARLPYLVTGYEKLDKREKMNALADATLAAAAPELLEALREILSVAKTFELLPVKWIEPLAKGELAVKKATI